MKNKKGFDFTKYSHIILVGSPKISRKRIFVYQKQTSSQRISEKIN